MKKKRKELIIGLLFAFVFGGALLMPEGNTANIMFFIFFIGGIAGILAVLLAPLSSFAGKGIMWEHYIPQSLIIVFMFSSPFPYLGYVFSTIITILFVKNVIAFDRY